MGHGGLFSKLEAGRKKSYKMAEWQKQYFLDNKERLYTLKAERKKYMIESVNKWFETAEDDPESLIHSEELL